MPVVRPFRSLRYDPDVAGDLADLVAPPYDVVGPATARALVARDPRNVIRLELPEERPGDPPDERYRRAARTLGEWRSEGALKRDPRPAFYVYEQAYRVPGSDAARVQRGFIGRLKLEPFGPGSGVRPHERTLAGPREDRYRLLRATGLNISPVVVLFEDAAGGVTSRLRDVSMTAPEVDLVDDDGVRHRLWVVTDPELLAELAGPVESGPVTIADGHHRYETALRYRDERRAGATDGSEDPAWDFVLALLLDAVHEPLTVLPTHRIVRGLGGSATGLVADAASMFEVRTVASSAELVDAFGSSKPGGGGRFGLWTRDGGAILTARPTAFDAIPASHGAAVRRLDVTLLSLALLRLCRISATDVAAGDRVDFSHDAGEAIRRVDAADGGADAAFLLEATPVADVIAVAADGDVMPEKSTFFYPKALTGLVLSPHEW